MASSDIANYDVRNAHIVNYYHPSFNDRDLHQSPMSKIRVNVANPKGAPNYGAYGVGDHGRP